MLLINLLPPELRKKRGGTEFNPVVLAVAACYLLALAPAGTWAWLKYVRLPAADVALEEANTTLAERTTQAEAVEALKGQIEEANRHRSLVVGLLAQKMYWARTLDDFANSLAGPWPSFEVCCTELTIMPGATEGRATARGPTNVVCSIRGRFKIVGDKRTESGDYVKAFFGRLETEPFWKQHGLQDKPERSYKGDSPNWNNDIQKIVVEFSLDWQRLKTISVSKGGS